MASKQQLQRLGALQERCVAPEETLQRPGPLGGPRSDIAASKSDPASLLKDYMKAHFTAQSHGCGSVFWMS